MNDFNSVPSLLGFEKAMNYLIKGRDNPAVVKLMDFVWTHFAEYVHGT